MDQLDVISVVELQRAWHAGYEVLVSGGGAAALADDINAAIEELATSSEAMELFQTSGHAALDASGSLGEALTLLAVEVVAEPEVVASASAGPSQLGTATSTTSTTTASAIFFSESTETNNVLPRRNVAGLAVALAAVLVLPLGCRSSA